MSALPAISILTPVWNGLPYIQECVESVIAQDFQDWEMIIGDNASERWYKRIPKDFKRSEN